MKQISKYIPEVEDRFFIDKDGSLYSNYGCYRMSDIGLRGGYVRNSLKLKEGSDRSFARHRLVMICYQYIEDYNNFQVNHKDGNKLNNSLFNLEWCTNQENRQHAVDTGLSASLIGETNPFHKLTEKEVLQIIEDLKNQIPFKDICNKYSISKSTVSAIRNHRNWKYLTKNIEFK